MNEYHVKLLIFWWHVEEVRVCHAVREIRQKEVISGRLRKLRLQLRNPSSPDVVFVMKALFSILDSLLTYITDSTNFCDASFSWMADHNYNIVKYNYLEGIKQMNE